ncbi:MAG: hypothetical protein IJ761_06000 [Bacteroidales bacterium]|nr:hypothetical protein [Bacteroidales bacterium]MBR1799434.1 hypothetical protein [Bacteroidales bacterium]
MNDHKTYLKPELIVVEMNVEHGYAMSTQATGFPLLSGNKSGNNGGSVNQYDDGSNWSSASDWF